MSINAYRTYEENRVLSASPVELVQILYRAAAGAVREARCHLEAGEIAGRSAKVSKAQLILLELSSSLDTERGGELAVRLVALYEYMQRRLSEANIEQRPEPLMEVERLLETLLEAWQQCADVSQPKHEYGQAPSDDDLSMAGMLAGVCG